MKHKVILSDREIASIIAELEISINSTDDYKEAMYLSNIVTKLRNSTGGDFIHVSKPHRPLQPSQATHA